jgi:hypothetical protein
MTLRSQTGAVVCGIGAAHLASWGLAHGITDCVAHWVRALVAALGMTSLSQNAHKQHSEQQGQGKPHVHLDVK